MSTSAFATWLKTAWTDFLTWFHTEEQKAASFLYPIITEIGALAKSDLLSDIIDLVPAVASAMTGAGGLTADAIEAGLATAKTLIVPLLEKQGTTIATTTLNTLANGLVAQATAAQGVSSGSSGSDDSSGASEASTGSAAGSGSGTASADAASARANNG